MPRVFGLSPGVNSHDELCYAMCFATRVSLFICSHWLSAVVCTAECFVGATTASCKLPHSKWTGSVHCGKIAQWRELPTLDKENPGSNPLLLCQTLGTIFTLPSSSSFSCMNQYLAIDSGGYLYMESLRINCYMLPREVKMVFD